MWLEFCNWKRSAPSYAAAVQLWGQAARVAQEPPWPPQYSTVCVFSTFFRNSASLGRYCSHIRSVLVLQRASLGELADTSRLVRGAEKAGERPARPKVWASTARTKALAAWASGAGRSDLARSWVVARHFCLRYSECLALGTSAAPFRITGARAVAVITFPRRKCYSAPVEVVRKCACAGGREPLCGVCALADAAAESATPFHAVTYPEALAFLKAGAAALGFEDAAAWGTHAFRRGFANDALRAGGPSALFWSGGWRGLAAFGYATARTRGAAAAAGWLMQYSDSSDGE